MGRMQPHAPISSASRRRLAGWLVGSSLQDVERDLVLETLSHTRGNQNGAAHLLGISVRTLRNKSSNIQQRAYAFPALSVSGVSRLQPRWNASCRGTGRQ